MNLRNSMLALALVALAAAPADAKRRRQFGNGGGSDYSSNGTFGLGLELGSPSGLNGKYFLSESTALNFGVGWIYDRYYYDDRDGIHLYLDHLWHPFLLASADAFQLPFYVGIGARLWSFDDRRDRFEDDSGFALGARVPLGIAFDFNNIPLDIFVQLTFVVDVLFGYRDERAGLHLEGSVGIRYWFD
ncbi:MAG: hypothetical protein H0X17_06940 [Deltaproteobacteria bacterium]|nr:hypothetical protein [Deltaproteobacteria bacterium]